jgi:hypothetical protein
LFNASQYANDILIAPDTVSLLASYDEALQTLAQNVDTQPLPVNLSAELMALKQEVNTQVTPVNLSAELIALKQEVETTPRLEIGTIASQNADNVNITGGKISGLVPPLPTASGGTALSAFTSGGTMYATSTTALTTGTLPVASGGSGAVTLTGYLYGNGTSPFTASTTIPNTDITGLGTMSTENIGVSGSFTTADIPPQTVTVVNGIITSIV